MSLEKLAGAFSGFGAGVQDPSYALKAIVRRREAEEERKRKSKLAELAASQDPAAMQQYGASQSPEALVKYAQSLNERNKPTTPLTSGLPEGYRWEGNKAVPIGGLPVKEEERKIMQDASGRQRYVDDGSLVFPNAESKKKDFKDPQLKASSFGNRMIESAKLFNPIFDELDVAGESVVSEGAEAFASLPTILGGKMLSNRARTPAQQQYRNAANEWIRAKLRKESGAVIAEDEMDEEYRTYFPVVGDAKATIEQKAKLRATATDSMIKESAGAYEELYGKDLKTQKLSDEKLLKALGL